MNKIFYILLPFLLMLGCQSKIIETVEPDFLLKATFTDNWVYENYSVIIFISDESGNLIAEKNVANDSTYIFEIPADLSQRTQNIIVSIIDINTQNEYSDYVSIRTYFNIEIGEEFIFVSDRYYMESIGSISLLFENIPEHAGYIYSTSNSMRRSTSGELLPSINYNISLYYEPDFLYTRLNTLENGPMYTIVDPVYSGDQLTISLDNLETPTQQIISLPNIGDNSHIFIKGYTEQGSYSSGYHYLEYSFVPDISSGQFIANYPQNRFEEFRTQITLYEDDFNWPIYNCFYHSIYGQIPDEFKMIDADVEIIQYNNHSVEIAPSGNFDVIRASWFFEQNDLDINWLMYGPENQSIFELPQLSNFLIIEYPQLSPDSFNFNYAAVDNYTELSDYDSFLDIKFKSGIFFNEQAREYCSRSKASGLAQDKINYNMQEHVFDDYIPRQ